MLIPTVAGIDLLDERQEPLSEQVGVRIP